MSYQRLSQAEIDMLLGSGGSSSDEGTLSQGELDTVGEIGTTAAGAAATSLGSLLSQSVALNNPTIGTSTMEELCQEAAVTSYIADIQFQEGFNGGIYLLFQESDSKLIVDLLMGNDGSNPPEDLGDMEISALTEAINQLAGNIMTAFSSLFKKKVISEPAQIKAYDLSQLETPIGITLDDSVVKVAFRLEIGTLSDSVLTMLIPMHLARDLAKAFEAASMPMPAPPPAETRPVANATPVRDTAAASAPAMGGAAGYGAHAAPETDYHGNTISAQPVQFGPFTPSAVGVPGNLNLILDVPLQITVELGRTKRQVKEVLDLGTGSIIELDKLTGDPVDIMINGKPIAEGEVVIIDENFAVRITKIKNMSDRLGAIQ